jgi:hypothetical protein
MSFVVRARSPRRSSSANAPLSTQLLDSEVASLARNRSKATLLRRRISATPLASASFFRRCSSAVRNAPAVSYLTATHPSLQRGG